MFPRAKLERRVSGDLQIFIGDDIGGLAVEDAQGGSRHQGGAEAHGNG